MIHVLLSVSKLFKRPYLLRVGLQWRSMPLVPTPTAQSAAGDLIRFRQRSKALHSPYDIVGCVRGGCRDKFSTPYLMHIIPAAADQVHSHYPCHFSRRSPSGWFTNGTFRKIDSSRAQNARPCFAHIIFARIIHSQLAKTRTNTHRPTNQRIPGHPGKIPREVHMESSSRELLEEA